MMSPPATTRISGIIWISKGEVIGPNDLKIAAICRANGFTLATGNLSEFRRVPDLKFEDWSAKV